MQSKRTQQSGKAGIDSMARSVCWGIRIWRISSPENLSDPDRAKRIANSVCVVDNTWMRWAWPGRKASRCFDTLESDHKTSFGFSETELKLLTVRPTGWLVEGLLPVTTVTPVGNFERACRKLVLSSRVISQPSKQCNSLGHFHLNCYSNATFGSTAMKEITISMR